MRRPRGLMCRNAGNRSHSFLRFLVPFRDTPDHTERYYYYFFIHPFRSVRVSLFAIGSRITERTQWTVLSTGVTQLLQSVQRDNWVQCAWMDSFSKMTSINFIELTQCCSVHYKTLGYGCYLRGESSNVTLLRDIGEHYAEVKCHGYLSIISCREIALLALFVEATDP